MNSRVTRCDEYRRFLAGGEQTKLFACLDPSSFAALFAGKNGGYPTLEDQIAFHTAYPSDSALPIPVDIGAVVPELNWTRTHLKDADGATYWEEKLATPQGEKCRVVGDRFGTISWLVEPAVRSEDDFYLIDYYAEHMLANAAKLAQSIAHVPARLREQGILPAVVIYSAFEVQYLIDYADMPLFYTDYRDRYLKSIEKIHEANLALLDEMAGIGIEMFINGSAGVELLSPKIFREAIVPFQREFNDAARRLGRSVLYHICGFSRQLIEEKLIDALKPTIFETCSTPPCGNNVDLRSAVHGISDEIITKGNLPLELMRDGTPDAIAAAVDEIVQDTRGRRHIIGQADATILEGTPLPNLEAFLNAVNRNEL